MSERIRIVIADDHRMVREGLKTFLLPIDDFELVGEASNGRDAVEQVERLQPDVLLLDLIMPEMDGIAATQALSDRKSPVRILIITSFAEDEKVISAVKAGALGYLLKDSSPLELEDAIREVSRGELYLPPQIARKVIRELNRATDPQVNSDRLTTRETEILQLVADGMSNDQIAQKLVLSPWTVRSHLGRIIKKLHVENRTQAAMSALRMGVVHIRI
jgi:two-component system, NarL family, response regulator LiaR